MHVLEDSGMNKQEGFYICLLKYHFHEVESREYIIFLQVHRPKWDITIYQNHDFQILLSFRNE